MKYGQVDEYVFLKECDYDDDKLSELNWDIKSEIYAGAEIEVGYKKFFSEMKITFGIPMKTGSMLDSDWINAKIQNTENYQYKTCYSEHDNYLDDDFSFDINLGYDFDIFNNDNIKIKINPLFGFEYNKISFTAKNGIGYYGYGWANNFKDKNGYYAKWNDEENIVITNFSGDVITYSRQTYIFWLGFDSIFTIFDKIDVDLGFKISPYIYAESIDTHIGRNTMFGDKTPGYFSAYKFNLGTSYKINDRNLITLNAIYFFTRTLRGNDYSKSTSAKTYNLSTDTDGGAAEHYFDISLSWRIKIF